MGKYIENQRGNNKLWYSIIILFNLNDKDVIMGEKISIREKIIFIKRIWNIIVRFVLCMNHLERILGEI